MYGYIDTELVPKQERHLPKNKLFSLAIQLEQMHPTIDRVGFEKEQFYIYFKDVPAKEMRQFADESQTRQILEQMAALITAIRKDEK